MRTPYTKGQRGFTIIETLVALAIFTFSILGLIVITSRGIADTNYAKNKLIAAYLAQEGIEIARNMRDSAALAGGTWQDVQSGALAACYAQNQITGCDVDAMTLEIESCSPALRSCGPLRYDAANGTHVLGSSNALLPETPFSRQVTLRDIGTAEIEVVSTVTWNQGAAPRSVSATESLMDWIRIGVPEE